MSEDDTTSQLLLHPRCIAEYSGMRTCSISRLNMTFTYSKMEEVSGGINKDTFGGSLMDRFVALCCLVSHHRQLYRVGKVPKAFS